MCITSAFIPKKCIFCNYILRKNTLFKSFWQDAIHKISTEVLKLKKKFYLFDLYYEFNAIKVFILDTIMDEALKKLLEEPIFKYFNDISMIPRGSGNEKKVSDYLVGFAKENKLEVIQDEVNNLIIKKPGTKGYENSPAIIIQGHIDMVCDKNKGKIHDFEKDPIELVVKDDMLYANETTLGADDGIAVAYAMALLASFDIAHPPLEVLLTVDEEVGLKGADYIDLSILKGRALINIDSEEEGKILVSSAGGVRTKITLNTQYESIDSDLEAYAISIRGLKGGHSGADIDKFRGNANKIIGRVLYDLAQKIDYYLYEINGGLKTNAIPRESDAVIFINKACEQKLFEIIKLWDGKIKNELKNSDCEAFIEVKHIKVSTDKVLSSATKNKLLNILMLLPDGVNTMSMSIKGLVESSNNLGILEVKENEIILEGLARSAIESLKHNILEKMKIICSLNDAKLETYSDYPAWEYDSNSKLREVFVNVYNKLYNKEPEIVAIHAGIECSLFKQKRPDMDMVSIGPDLYDVHTPDEHISISSTRRTWEYIKNILKELK